MNDNKTKKIMFSGGGTGGSVTPLLAVAEELLKETHESDGGDLELLFVGTKTGLERGMVETFAAAPLRYIPLSGGKWRRYFSVYNFWDIFKIGVAFFQSLILLTREKPAVIISAGSFISVPLVWAAALKKIPILIHQQDARPGLANKLMAPAARVITVTFENSLADYGVKAVWTGNPSGDMERYKERIGETKIKYGLQSDRPLVLIAGGGTGSAAINKLVSQARPELIEFCQIIHLTGKGKLFEQRFGSAQASDNPEMVGRYQTREFLNNEEFLALTAAADLVVSRCGLGTLTELSALGKPTILIPMPDSHQEDNAAIFRAAEAAVILEQKDLTPEKLTDEVKQILSNPVLRERLKKNIAKVIKRGAAKNLAGLIWEMIK